MGTAGSKLGHWCSGRKNNILSFISFIFLFKKNASTAFPIPQCIFPPCTAEAGLTCLPQGGSRPMLQTLAEQSRYWPRWQEGCRTVASAPQPNSPLNLLGQGKKADRSGLVSVAARQRKGPKSRVFSASPTGALAPLRPLHQTEIVPC